MTKRTYAVWGTRAVGQWLAEEIIRLGDRVSVYCSSSKTSQGKLINGTPVISPEKLKDLCSKQEITHIVLGMVSESHKQKVREILKCEFPKGIHIINSDDIQNQYLLNVRSQWNNSWHIDFQNQGTIWLQNFMKEVEYWVQYVVNPNGRDHHTYHEWLSNADFAGIDKTCTILEPTLRDGSVVLDLGSGLVSKYGTRLPDNKTIQLVPVDALAYFYNKINQKYAPGKIQTCNFGMFEFIADFYSENNFDAIVISNALDHCIDPYKSIIECLYVLKKGGRMHLVHRRAEAVFEGYDGLHKWNIDYNEHNDLVIWNEYNTVNVTESLKEIAEIRLTHEDDFSPRRKQLITVEITKAKNFLLENSIDMEKERHYLAFLVEGLMKCIADGIELENFLTV